MYVVFDCVDLGHGPDGEENATAIYAIHGYRRIRRIPEPAVLSFVVIIVFSPIEAPGYKITALKKLSGNLFQLLFN